MTKSNGLPCKKCGTSKWYKWGHCKQCLSEQKREWNNKNRDVMKNSSRRWQQANPGLACKRVKEWRIANPDKVIAHSHERRARKRRNGGSYSVEEWRILCTQYDNHCCYPGCERTDIEVDHIIPISAGGCNSIDNIQPLCAHHNREKHTKIADYRYKPDVVRWTQGRLFDRD